MPSCAFPHLRLAVSVVLCFSVRAFAGQQLVCSSDSLSIWWEYEGPVVLTSVELPHCTLGMSKFFLTYTGMPLFTMVQMGWHVRILFKNDTWMDLSQPLGLCEDFRICDIIKGETIHETFPVHVHPLLFTPDGEYQLFFTITIIDDLDREISLRAKVTLHVRNKNRRRW